MEEKMDGYKVQYRVKGIGVTLEELIPARSNFEAEQILRARIDPDKLYIVQTVKQQSSQNRQGNT
jgi:hypothetical protein